MRRKHAHAISLVLFAAVAAGGAVTWLGAPGEAATSTAAAAADAGCLAHRLMMIEVARDATEPRLSIPASPVARCPATPIATAPPPEPTTYYEPPPTYTYPY